MTSKITIRNLDFFYGQQQALFGVTMDLPPTSITAIIGPSGCGKSTLLRVLNRIYEEYSGERASGEVKLDGKDILDPQVDLKLLRSRVGMVFQSATMFKTTIFENVAFGLRLNPALSHAGISQGVEAALTRADLWSEVKDRLSGSAESLSGGQQQRLCIARALAVGPEVLLLDEPTGALNPGGTEAVEELIVALKREVTIVLVTHNLHQALRCADQVSFFYLGKLIETGTTRQIFDAPVQTRTKNYVAGKFG